VKSRFVTDTMALILRLERRKLSQKIKAIFENAESGKGKLIIPVMVLAEIGYLSEKERIETNLNEVKDYSLKYESM
jgi:predicted nucleic acid-binding protein